MSGARLGARGKAFNKTNVVPAPGTDSLVGRAGIGQVFIHVIIATEGEATGCSGNSGRWQRSKCSGIWGLEPKFIMSASFAIYYLV